MPGVTLSLHLFLLQEQVRYFKEDDPTQALILVIAIAVIVVFSIVMSIIRRGGKKKIVGSGSGGSSGYATPKRFSTFSLRRAARPYGLSGEQNRLLEEVFRNDNVTDPARVLQNSAVLDKHFKRAYKSIDKGSRNTERTQQNISKLYILRNAIEAAPVHEDANQPVENSQAIIKYGKDNYNVKVLVSRGDNIVTEIPKSTLGTPLKVSNGTNVNLTYLSRSNNSYNLTCSYVGIEKTEHGAGFQMNSNGNPKALTKRKYRRKQVDIRCEFFFVQLVESGKGRKKTSKLVVSPKKFSGYVRDIGAGGCSIRTPVPVQAGSRLKINCYLGHNNQISVLGQVIRINRSAAGTVIHVKFLKVPMRAFNLINTLVFGFDENPEKKDY
jgi:hypothetical protein